MKLIIAWACRNAASTFSPEAWLPAAFDVLCEASRRWPVAQFGTWSTDCWRCPLPFNERMAETSQDPGFHSVIRTLQLNDEALKRDHIHIKCFFVSGRLLCWNDSIPSSHEVIQPGLSPPHPRPFYLQHFYQHEVNYLRLTLILDYLTTKQDYELSTINTISSIHYPKNTSATPPPSFSSYRSMRTSNVRSINQSANFQPAVF